MDWRTNTKKFSINFLFIWSDKYLDDFIPTATITAAALTLRGTDPTGKISDGYVSLSGPMRES
jgi:hypothetical protein